MATDETAFSCFVSTVGLVLPFVLTDPPVSAGLQGVAISNAESATVTWINQAGFRRSLVLSNADSAVYTYILSLGDTRSPHAEQGYLLVDFGGTVVMTSAFTFVVHPHF
jgi:hypothetical protein